MYIATWNFVVYGLTTCRGVVTCRQKFVVDYLTHDQDHQVLLCFETVNIILYEIH